MRTPSVALLIPVFGDQDGLEYSLKRLPNELRLDVVIVDDGSQPPIKAPRTIGSHTVSVIRLERNCGIDRALNAGLQWILRREYDYVARLDAGDVALPGRFLKQVEFLEAHPDYALVGGQARFVDREGRVVFREYLPTEDEQIRRVMHTRNCFIHPAVMLRTSVIRKLGPYSEDFKAAEDYEYFFRILQQSKVANLPDEVVVCAFSPKGISLSRRRTQIISRLKVMLRYFDPTMVESYLGLLKSVLLCIAPILAVLTIKRYFRNRRAGWR